jgi:CO/xanthine dehydrogenase FAD-binding subunit
MASVCGYRRPGSPAEALFLLSRPGTVIVGGGTRLHAAAAEGPVLVVDLQALGLDRISPCPDGRVRIGATTTLQQISGSAEVPPVLRDAARRERPSALRAQATLGGCVASAEADSELLAALLAHDAVLSIARPGETPTTGLTEFLAGPPPVGAWILTGLTVDGSGRSVAVRAGRTRADRPIVAAVARVTATGQRRLALAGVAEAPVLVQGPADIAALDPPGDFRGSGEYRRALAAVLASRALEAIS